MFSNSIDADQSAAARLRHIGHCNPGSNKMDHEFDQALQALADLQFKHGIPSILLSMQGPTGDVVATLRRPQQNTFDHYARVNRHTRQIVRLRP